ncbi:MAG: alkylhydroperoxidase [Desulforhopalus sp.]
MDSVCWIKTIPYEKSAETLREIYDKVKSPQGGIDNVYEAQSLRPHTILGHDVLYKSVLHNSGNALPDWFLEAIGVYTCLLLKCSYAVTHHFANMKALLNDDIRSDTIFAALSDNHPEKVFQGKELALLQYTSKLTQSPEDMEKSDIRKLQNLGLEDGLILEVNQVCASFNYSARVINGLGVNIGNDVVGFYP